MGYVLILSCFPDVVLPSAPVFWFSAEWESYTASAGAMLIWMCLFRLCEFGSMFDVKHFNQGE